MKSFKIFFALFLILAMAAPVFAQPAATPDANQERANAMMELLKNLDPVQQELLIKVAKKLESDETHAFQQILKEVIVFEPEPLPEPAYLDETIQTEPMKPGYQQKAEAMTRTQIVFENEEYDFGQVKDGDMVKHVFTFRNVGSEPFVLQRAKASCGCTVPTFTKTNILPGEEGTIHVEFNSKNKVGMQTKTITVTGNFEGSVNQVLRIKGEVLPSQK